MHKLIEKFLNWLGKQSEKNPLVKLMRLVIGAIWFIVSIIGKWFHG